MRVSFKFTIALAVVAALASSISAIPTNADAAYSCPVFCRHTRECDNCNYPHCVSFSDLCPKINHLTYLH